jgi:predicted RNA-binding protein associated with RNAse of E/G family
MSAQKQLEREEDELVTALNRGEISVAEYNKQMREIHRDYNQMARETAEDAYNREMERW